MLEKPKLLSLRSLYAVGFVFLMACYTLMSARVLEPFSGAIDLGRHLRDGEFLLSSSAWHVLHSNSYSYTDYRCSKYCFSARSSSAIVGSTFPERGPDSSEGRMPRTPNLMA